MTDPQTKSTLLLIDAWLDGTASEAEASTLFEVLQTDDAALELFADRTWVHRLLQRAHQRESIQAVTGGAPCPSCSGRQSVFTKPRIVAAAAIVVLALTAFWFGRMLQPAVLPSPGPVAVKLVPVKPAPAPVVILAAGTIATVVDALSVDGSEEFHKGDVLRPGDYFLNEGYLQIALHDGTNLLFEAPAEFTLHETTKKLSLDFGRVVSRASHGFTVHTASAVITDLGTEFGVYCADDRTTETFVFEGSVTIAGESQSAPQTLTVNQARRVAADGKTSVAIAANPEAYTTRSDLAALQRGGGERFARWWNLNKKLRRDPACVLFLPQMSLPKNGILANEALPAGNAPAIASVNYLGGEFLQGRLRSTFGLDCEEENSGLTIPGEHRFKKITISGWFYFHDQPHKFTQPLMMSTFAKAPGELHWQIKPEGDMMVGFSGQAINFKSGPQIEKTKQWRQWHHLAITVDTKTRRVQMFWNGKKVHSSISRKTIPEIVLRNATIGRYEDSAPRWLNGAIGEQMVFSRILTDGELLDIFQAGR